VAENRQGSALTKHYGTLETRTPAEREKALMQALPQQIAATATLRAITAAGVQLWID
jgi:hypothetical protein